MKGRSDILRAQNKVQTQMALRLIWEVGGYSPTGTERDKLVKRMKQEIPCEKHGEGRGAFCYFDIDDVRRFAEKLGVRK